MYFWISANMSLGGKDAEEDEPLEAVTSANASPSFRYCWRAAHEAVERLIRYEQVSSAV